MEQMGADPRSFPYIKEIHGARERGGKLESRKEEFEAEMASSNEGGG